MTANVSLDDLDPKALPRHVAVIMDGNGRWAKMRGMPRGFGHKQGVEATKRLVRAAHHVGLEALTIYGFSTENWKRPQDEIGLLMGLLKTYFTAEIAELHRANVQIRVIGTKDDFTNDIKTLLEQAERVTAENTGMVLSVALSYGARHEILNSVKVLAERVAKGELAPSDLTEDMIEQGLETTGLPDPDLIIRTSGEQRLSNFLMWQAAYAELYFDSVLWPDYTAEHLAEALHAFANRDRRFGGLNSASSAQ